MNTSLVRLFARALPLLLVLTGIQSFAQSKQYQRRVPKQTSGVNHPPEKAGAVSDASSTASPTDSKATAAPPAEAAPGKVDVSDLEKKYWVPKDTEFQVVQNRTYSKANRLAVTGSMGTIIGDYYSKVNLLGITANYYMSERTGIQVQYLKFNSADNETVDYFRNNYAAVPDFGRTRTYYGFAYNWIPIYAKLSLLEQKIIYFDMSISPGIGMTEYDQIYVTQAGDKKTAVTFSLDVAQHFFLSQHLAFRLDFINHLFNEEIKNARNPSEVKRTRLNHTIIIQGGLTFHF